MSLATERTLQFIPDNDALAWWWMLSTAERAYYGVLCIIALLVCLYLFRQLNDFLTWFKRPDKNKYKKDANGVYRSPDGFDIDGYGMTEDDGYSYDRAGMTKDGYGRDGLDEAGFRRSGFSDYGTHKLNGLMFSPVSGLDVDGLDLNGHRPVSSAERDYALALFQQALAHNEKPRLLKMTGDIS